MKHTLRVGISLILGVCLIHPAYASGLNFDIREKDPTTTKGDVSTHNGTAPTRLAVGSDGEILSADASTSTGLRWVTAPTGGITGIAADSGGTATGSTVTVAGGTGMDTTRSTNTITFDFDSTEIENTTWGSGTNSFTWTFSSGAGTPSIDFRNNSFEFNADNNVNADTEELTITDANFPSLGFQDTSGDDFRIRVFNSTITLINSTDSVNYFSADSSHVVTIGSGSVTKVRISTDSSGIGELDLPLNSVNLQGHVGGTLPVANGGTGLTSGTSGGVLAFTAAGTISSSNLLTASAVIVGGGAGAAPSAITADTATVGHFLGSTAASPAFRQVVTSDVNGVIGTNNGGTGLTSYTKGDLIVPNAAGFFLKLPVGTVDGYVLSVDSSTTTGLKWGSAGAGGGSGTPGGATTQIQYNSAGAFAGASLVTTDGVSIRVGPNTSPLVSCDVNGPIRSIPFALTDAASIAVDLSKSSFFTVTLGGNRTLANPTNGFPGAKFMLLVSQDATGNRFMGFGTSYKFGSDVPSYDSSKTATTKDYIGFIMSGTTSADVVSVSRGFR